MESTIPNEIKSLKSQTKTLNLSTREILNVDEAIAFLQLSRSCLYKKTSQKQIPYYKPPGCKRIYFRKKELEEWLLCNRVKTTMELEQDSKGYLSKKAKFLKSC
ncbi:helix-turn-helix transcriptional regulator [Flavobacterium sp.]|uniref:helix-turn-helix transcriptional regulator n=1 Tax=Flavobacterium sp. TaxID=239 RepID=UPI0035AE14F7